MQFITRISAFIFCCQFALSVYAQPDSFQLLDGIIAVVGDEIILHSEMEDRVFQEKLQGRTVNQNNRCLILEEMLFEKLLLHNARIDSLVVNDAEVMDESLLRSGRMISVNPLNLNFSLGKCKLR
jgi:hypothetical protein